VAAGSTTVESAFDYSPNVYFPLSGLHGDLWRAALLKVRASLGSAAEFDVSFGLRDHLRITSTQPAVLSSLVHLSNPETTGAFDDAVVGTKIRLAGAAESPNGVAVQTLTRLPNAKHGSGLGQNTFDWYARLLLTRSWSTMSATTDVGLGILGDPLRGNDHLNCLTYAAALRSATLLGVALRLAIEARTGDPSRPGLEPRATARVGGEVTRGSIFSRLELIRGLTDRDGGIGASVMIGAVFVHQ
jgi:hypothetical protein